MYGDEAVTPVEDTSDSVGLDIETESVPTEDFAFEADAFSVYAVVVTETIETRYIAADGQSFIISVGYGPEAEIPANAELAVEEIPQGSEAWESYCGASMAAMNSGNDSMIRFARFFDIEIMSEGQKIEPAAPVEVKITYDAPVEVTGDAKLSVVHFADAGTEVIDSLALNDEATEITYQQASFSVTGTIVTGNPDNGEHYALVILHEGEYYVVENDGVLTRISAENIEFNGDGSVKTVKMANPLSWTYKDLSNNGNGCIYHDTTARAYDYPGSSLPKAYVHRYLSVDENDGYYDIDDDKDTNVWTVYNAYGNNCLVLQYNPDSHKINHYDRYLGVGQNSDGVLSIRGRCAQNDAATVYLAKAELIKPVNVLNHTVNHIDISVDGKADIKVPLDFGDYGLATIDNLENLNNADLKNHITNSGRTLHVNPDNEITLEVERIIPITDDDLKKAGVSAYTDWNGTKTYRDDVFNVIGYSRNAPTNSDTAQVRLEGSFKVSDLDPLPENYTEEEANRNEYQNTGKMIRQVRLERPIYYSISITKPVTFTMTYYDEQTNQTYVVLDANGDPIRKTVDMTLARTFSYWDKDNACPALTLYNEDKWWHMSSKDRWALGEMSSNSEWNQKVYDDSHGETALDGGPGMDFRLTAEAMDETKNVVSIKVTKYVQGIYGDNDVRTLELLNGTTCDVDVYQNGSATPKHRRDLPVGKDGMGMIVDMDVEGSNDYEQPATVQISEDPASVADELVDSDGYRWVYDHTRVETEFAFRNNGQPNPERYISPDYAKPSDNPFYSNSEVLGKYAVPDGVPYTINGVYREGKKEFNGIEEFFIYNIYKPKTYPVKIKKVDATTLSDDGLKGAEFDLYGPYTAQEVWADGFDPKQRKWNENTITTDDDGLAEIRDLVSGHYYLVETKAPEGFVLMTEPVAFSVDSLKETQGENAVSYAQGPNTLKNDGLEFDDATGTFILTVTNNPGVRLPSTGGAGTGAYTAGGAALMLLAVALLLMKRRQA